MKILLPALSAAIVFTVLAATPVKKPAAKKKGTPARHSTSAKRKGTPSAALAGVTGPRNRQNAPAPERYKEIQQALASKGYLKAEPNGIWDSQSTDALTRFQADQKLDPTGKLNAPSLIGLGLGPQTPHPSAPAPAPQ